jgi:hypothetical protein
MFAVAQFGMTDTFKVRVERSLIRQVNKVAQEIGITPVTLCG